MMTGARTGAVSESSVELPPSSARPPSSESPTVQTRRFDHVGLVVSDLAASVAFYRDRLGLREVPRPAFSFRGAWLASGDAVIHLLEENVGNGRGGQAIPDVEHLSRTRHLAFEVDDASDAATKLQQAGVSIVVGPKFRPDGAVQAYLHDPDGHLIELYSDPPCEADRTHTADTPPDVD